MNADIVAQEITVLAVFIAQIEFTNILVTEIIAISVGPQITGEVALMLLTVFIVMDMDMVVCGAVRETTDRGVLIIVFM